MRREVSPLESSLSSPLRCPGSVIAQTLAVAQVYPLGKEGDLRSTQKVFPLDLFPLTRSQDWQTGTAGVGGWGNEITACCRRIGEEVASKQNPVLSSPRVKEIFENLY